VKCRLSELRNKEVINIKNGARLGYVDDIELETETASVKSFIVYGRTRFFGFFGREDDLIITCDEIEVVGIDTILISADDAKLTKRRLSTDI